MNPRYKITLAVLAGAALGAAAIQGLHAQAKPPVYSITETEVTDPAVFKTFQERNAPILKSFGGRPLVRADKSVALEGVPPKGRVAVTAWDSMEKLQAYRNSAEYKEIAPIRAKSTTFRSYVVEGLAN